MQQVTVWREAGRFAAWPANYGIWSWGQEVVVGYTVGYYKPSQTSMHAVDKSRPFVTCLSRSLDGGVSWDVAPFSGTTPGGRGLSIDEHANDQNQLAQLLGGTDGPKLLKEPIDFGNPNLSLMFARSGLNAGSRSWYYVSLDRCHQWLGPYDLPTETLLPSGEPGISARTDYIVESPSELLVFLTAVKPDGKEGRTFCARLEDGGTSMKFVSWVTPEPDGYAIMPASVRISSSHLLCAVRYSGPRFGPERPPCWIDLFESHDNGGNWGHLGRPVDNTGAGGNPPTLTRLADGRLLMTYGYRNPPYGIYAILSDDNGVTWTAPLTLRVGAGNNDFGYPRTVQLENGNVVTAYYWNDAADGERYIAVTIWRP